MNGQLSYVLFILFVNQSTNISFCLLQLSCISFNHSSFLHTYELLICSLCACNGKNKSFILILIYFDHFTVIMCVLFKNRNKLHKNCTHEFYISRKQNKRKKCTEKALTKGRNWYEFLWLKLKKESQLWLSPFWLTKFEYPSYPSCRS